MILTSIFLRGDEMRRVKNLENVLYHKNYKEIYKIVFTADLDRVEEHSHWYMGNKGYVESNRPLWIICESKLIGKRIWITEEFGEKQITTADLNLDVKSREYSESFRHKTFKSQKEMITFLKELFKPCLYNDIPTEIKEGIYQIIKANAHGEFLNFNVNNGNIIFGLKVSRLLPLVDTVNIEEYERMIEKTEIKEDIFGAKEFEKFKERYSYLYETGLKNLENRKHIIKVFKDCFGGVNFFGYTLDIKTNKYKQHTDGMYIDDIVEEYPEFNEYYYKHSKELKEEYEKKLEECEEIEEES